MPFMMLLGNGQPFYNIFPISNVEDDIIFGVGEQFPLKRFPFIILFSYLDYIGIPPLCYRTTSLKRESFVVVTLDKLSKFPLGLHLFSGLYNNKCKFGR